MYFKKTGFFADFIKKEKDDFFVISERRPKGQIPKKQLFVKNGDSEMDDFKNEKINEKKCQNKSHKNE